MQLSSDSTGIGCSIESDELSPESSTGTAVDKNSYVTEGNKSKSRKRPNSTADLKAVRGVYWSDFATSSVIYQMKIWSL